MDSSYCTSQQAYLGVFAGQFRHGTFRSKGLIHRNVLGGNFSLVGIPSVGASGAIFGAIAVSTFPEPGHRAVINVHFFCSLGHMGGSVRSLEIPLSSRSSGE